MGAAATSNATIDDTRRMPSDLRLKTSLFQIGKSPSGIPLYHFSYLHDPCKILYLGALAQDVLHLKPEAVSVDASGFYNIDYSKTDVQFSAISDVCHSAGEHELMTTLFMFVT